MAELTGAVGEGEAKAMASLILEDTLGYTPARQLMYGDRELLPESTDMLMRIATRVKDGEPVQYALGKAHFRGRVFKVNPSVLIPRPETSQLVDMIVDASGSRTDLRVLDIGTGSGCIAISLALDLKFPEVDAIDISADALTVARENAEALRARINFIQQDATRLPGALAGNQYDVIVSNPPYVLESERAGMDSRVKDHEPGLALFAPDNDPIGIYNGIAGYGMRALEPGGSLYLEINPLCSDKISDMLRPAGYTSVSIIRDYTGTERFATARKADH